MRHPYCTNCAMAHDCEIGLFSPEHNEGGCAAFVPAPVKARPDGERLLKSMDCIRQWAGAALEHLPPFGNQYAAALQAIKAEADAAVETEAGE